MKTERTVNALAEMNGRVHVYLPNQAIGTRFIQQAEKGGAAVCVSSDFYKKKRNERFSTCSDVAGAERTVPYSRNAESIIIV